MAVPPFAVPDIGPVANDNGGSPVGVGVETAIPAPEHRLALAVARAPISAARAGLGRAVRRNGDGGYAEFGGFLSEEFADVVDGGLGEAFVEFSFGSNVLPGARAVPRADAIKLMGCRLSTATSLGWVFSRMLRICRRISWSRRWE